MKKRFSLHISSILLSSVFMLLGVGHVVRAVEVTAPTIFTPDNNAVQTKRWVVLSGQAEAHKKIFIKVNGKKYHTNGKKYVVTQEDGFFSENILLLNKKDKKYVIKVTAQDPLTGTKSSSATVTVFLQKKYEMPTYTGQFGSCRLITSTGELLFYPISGEGALYAQYEDPESALYNPSTRSVHVAKYNISDDGSFAVNLAEGLVYQTVVYAYDDLRSSPTLRYYDFIATLYHDQASNNDLGQICLETIEINY